MRISFESDADAAKGLKGVAQEQVLGLGITGVRWKINAVRGAADLQAAMGSADFQVAGGARQPLCRWTTARQVGAGWRDNISRAIRN